MKTAFLFSGQGAQVPGMFADLYEREPAVRAVFDAADAALGRPISGLSFRGAQEELNLTHNTQPCVLAADLAAGMLLRAKGVEPDAVAGFSLGEYAALTFSGAIPADDVFPMIQLRADAMQAAVPAGAGAMAALIGKDADQAAELCAAVRSGAVWPANYNCPVQTVISGEAAAVAEAMDLAKARGLTCVLLPVSAPFHCELMRPAAAALEALFRTKTFSAPRIPVYMNVTGAPLTDAAAIPDLLVRQATSPVLWTDTLRRLQADGIDTLIECGPGRTLSGLARKTLRGVKILRVEDAATLAATLEALGR